MKNHIFKSLISTVLSATLYLALTPGIALAADFDKGLDNLISLGVKIIVLIILVAGAIKLSKSEVSKVIVVVVVGAVVISIAEIDKIKEIGTSLISLITGG